MDVWKKKWKVNTERKAGFTLLHWGNGSNAKEHQNQVEGIQSVAAVKSSCKYSKDVNVLFVQKEGVLVNYLPDWLLVLCLLRNLCPGFQRRRWGWCHCQWTPGSWWGHSHQTAGERTDIYLLHFTTICTIFLHQNTTLHKICFIDFFLLPRFKMPKGNTELKMSAQSSKFVE